MAYKLLELKNMSVYWDTSAEIYSNKSVSELSVSYFYHYQFILFPKDKIFDYFSY